MSKIVLREKQHIEISMCKWYTCANNWNLEYTIIMNNKMATNGMIRADYTDAFILIGSGVASLLYKAIIVMCKKQYVLLNI